MDSDLAVRKKRSWKRWPPEAAAIARKKINPVAMCIELMTSYGHDKEACWRFLKKHGVERPGSVSRHAFSPELVETIAEYVGEHGIQAGTKRFHCPPKSLYNVLYKNGFTHRARDGFSLREVCTYLRVRYAKAMSWIQDGLLEADSETTRTGKTRYFVRHRPLEKFCLEHRDLLLTRRLSLERLAFIEQYIFAPKHAELLRTRESKREQKNYELQRVRESDSADQTND
jgi:hypothetical protein